MTNFLFQLFLSTSEEMKQDFGFPVLTTVLRVQLDGIIGMRLRIDVHGCSEGMYYQTMICFII